MVFDEAQRIRSPFILTVILILTFGVGFGFYKAIWQDAISVVPVVMMLLVNIFAAVSLSVLSMRTRITGRQLTIQLFPFAFVRRTIRHSDIATFNIRRLNRSEQIDTLTGFAGNQNTSVLVLRTTHALWIKLKNGQELIVGTREPQKLTRSVASIL